MFPPLYAILDSTPEAPDVLPLARALAGAGVDLLQLRAKKTPARAVFEAARQLKSAFGETSVRLIVNDRLDIALIAGAAGVHVGQEDLPAEDARRVCGQGMWVGVSTHNLEQLYAAASTSADYIAVGPVFPTGTKENPDPVVGLEFVRRARAATKKPLVAIGGITVDSAGQVYRAGADSVAVIRDLRDAPDPGKRAREYMQIAVEALASRS
ncbi:MAG TPA: thiamine phosphate synthase [Candidatus Acidoferrum sp.]|nr:thiamine phosphate synthase [Candidatus Acidoferrum sp.]